MHQNRNWNSIKEWRFKGIPTNIYKGIKVQRFPYEFLYRCSCTTSLRVCQNIKAACCILGDTDGRTWDEKFIDILLHLKIKERRKEKYILEPGKSCRFYSRRQSNMANQTLIWSQINQIPRFSCFSNEEYFQGYQGNKIFTPHRHTLILTYKCIFRASL